MNSGQTGYNKLDQHCREHDIAYDKYKQGAERRKADEILARDAWERVKAKDSNFSEKLAALGVAGVMKTKAKLGLGLNKKKKKDTVQSTIKAFKNKTPNTTKKAAQLLLNTTLAAIKKTMAKDKRKNSKTSRVLAAPKIGSALPALLWPILSTIGALAGGTATVATAIKTAKNANKALAETKRHNEALEDIAKNTKNTKNTSGEGVFLEPYKRGSGIKKRKSNKPKKLQGQNKKKTQRKNQRKNKTK